RRVVVEVRRARSALRDCVGRAYCDAHVEAVAAVQRVTDVGTVTLRLEPIGGAGLPVGTRLRDRDLGPGLERVGDRAAGGVAIVGERAGAVGAVGRCVVRDV